MSVDLFKRFEAITELENAARLLLSLVETSCIAFDMNASTDGECTLFDVWQSEPYASNRLFSRLPSLDEIESALKILSEYSAPPLQTQKKAAEARPRRSELFPSGYSSEAVGRLCDRIREINTLSESCASLSKEIVQLDAELESLLPWEGYDEPLCTKGTEHTFLCLGSVPVKYDIDELIAELNGYEASLQPISWDDSVYYVRLIAHKASRDTVLSLMEKYEFSIHSHEDRQGTARSILNADRRRRLAIEGESIRIEERLDCFAESADRLGALYDLAATYALCLELSRGVASSETVACIRGILPVFCIEMVTKIFESLGVAYEFFDTDDGEGYFIAKNGKFAKKYGGELLKYLKAHSKAAQRALYIQSGTDFLPAFPSEIYTEA